MCYLPGISEQIPGIFHYLDEHVYDCFEYNISYKLYPTGYSTAYIEYKVTDPYKNRTFSIRGRLIASRTYAEQIHEDIGTLLYLFINSV